MISRVAVLGASVIAVGCTPARIVSLESPPEADRAELLVYRAFDYNAAGMAAIFGADRKDFLKLGTETYAELRLTPKTYEFFVRDDQADRPYRITIELKQNSRTCLELYPNPNRMLKAPLIFLGNWMNSDFLLMEVDCTTTQGINSYKNVAMHYE